MLKSDFRVVSILDNSVTIYDNDGKVSVTNDAENVVSFLFEKFGDKRFYYYDTDGQLTELLHSKGEFSGYGC